MQTEHLQKQVLRFISDKKSRWLFMNFWAFLIKIANRPTYATPATAGPDPVTSEATATAMTITPHKVHLLSLRYVPCDKAVVLYHIQIIE